MPDVFSFQTADQLIDILTDAHSLIAEKSETLLRLFSGLGEYYRDTEYEVLNADMQRTWERSAELNETLLKIISRISTYRDEMASLVEENWTGEAISNNMQTVLSDNNSTAPDEKENNSALKNELDTILKKKTIPRCARQAYMRWGKKCKIASTNYRGVAFFCPSKGYMKFNFREDLLNPCGKLSTFFHEIGHMIDCNAVGGRSLSDDPVFIAALRTDWTNYLTSVQRRYTCSASTAMRYIKSELMSDNNLYSDVSDIIGALTNCECQNFWGHDQSYWQSNPSRMQKEAFANMYSVIMGDVKRSHAMSQYFPTAYKRFCVMLEGCL